jgi:uncharacterized membrane protein YgdD (TMEM256/DUF423 family)
MMNKIIRIGAMVAAVAVVLGAFGAHKLKEILDEKSLANWETGCRYQFYHAFALLFTGLLYAQEKLAAYKWSAYFFLAGILFFSGSLYLLSLRNILNVNLLWLGPITPIGGLFFIIGWLRIVFAREKMKL